ncbi:MAG TPA: hypothetical protein VJT75_04105 [Thermoleophilaceae bacterium]|nr:hypothetical protein [Thermoleophilaceae bacterium]
MRRSGVAATMAATAVLAGCASGHPAVVQWVDATASAGGTSMRLCTMRARGVTEQVAAKDGTAAVERLDASTANAPTFEVTATFDTPTEIAADPDRIRRHHAEQVGALYRRAAVALRAPPRGYTDVVGALNASGSWLESRNGGRFAWLCSDGLDRRLLRLPVIDRAHVERLLRRLRQLRQIPRLHGATVVFDTTSSTARDRLGPSEQQAVEFFYRALVREGGGHVGGFGTGTRLPLR